VGMIRLLTTTSFLFAGHPLTSTLLSHDREGVDAQSLMTLCLTMKRSIAFCLAGSLLSVVPAESQVDEPLKFLQSVALPGLHDGTFDHFETDVSGQRLFLTAEDNSAVKVIDMRTNTLLSTITVPHTPHSMAYDKDLNKLFVVDETQVEIYDGASYHLLGVIPMKAHADASIYDRVKKILYVGNGGRLAKEDYCLISIVDARTDKAVGDIKVDSDHIEGMALEKSGPRLFVNMYSKNALGVIDREKRAVIATWSIEPEGRQNIHVSFDEAKHRLYVSSINRRDPAKVIVLDSNTGKIVSVLLSPGQFSSDDMAFDPAMNRLYVAGVPFINVFQGNDLIGQVPSSWHGITAMLVPELNRYYVAVNHHGTTDAKVHVYEVVR
jgi:DNA-binding beta-propeller fold protein YncE